VAIRDLSLTRRIQRGSRWTRLVIALAAASIVSMWSFFLTLGVFVSWTHQLTEPITYLVIGVPLALHLLVAHLSKWNLWKVGGTMIALWTFIAVWFTLTHATANDFPDVIFFCIGPASLLAVAFAVFSSLQKRLSLER